VGHGCQREREKNKKKRKRGRGYRRAAGPVQFWAGPVGFQHFFCLNLFLSFFYFLLLVSLLFEVQKYFENKTFELVRFK
jgi:hypothetical protein